MQLTLIFFNPLLDHVKPLRELLLQAFPWRDDDVQVLEGVGLRVSAQRVQQSGHCALGIGSGEVIAHMDIPSPSTLQVGAVIGRLDGQIAFAIVVG